MKPDPWVRTYTGRRVHILRPNPNSVDIQDIAQALSHTCRFGGHVPRFYSVAQHSVVVADMLPPSLALWGLLHDASEAYLHDVTRPLKQCLRNYAELERRHQAAVCIRFGLSPEMPWVVKCADNVALATEFRDLHGESLENCAAWANALPMGNRSIKPLRPEAARNLFMARFESILRRAG